MSFQLGEKLGETLDMWDTVKRISALPIFDFMYIALRSKLERRFRH